VKSEKKKAEKEED